MIRQVNKSRHNILLNIFSENGEIVFQMSQDATVGQLKIEIYDRLKISPTKQLIDSWRRHPKNDDETLQNCCHPETQLLIVSNADNLKDNESNGENHLEYLECCAAMDFIEKFSNNFDDQGICFHACTLTQALNASCHVSLDKRKILFLYLHNRTDPFSTVLGESLTDHEVKEIINRRFFLLGWDLEDAQYHKALSEALMRVAELSCLSDFIKKQTCAALLIVPINDSFILFSCMKSKMSKNDILETLKKADETLLEDIISEKDIATSENMNDIGSTEYQQLMLDQLGDRDYDSFEYDEFDELKKKIAYALYGPPQEEDGYPEKIMKNVEKLFRVIITENNRATKWKDRVVISFIYNCTEPLPSEKRKRAKKYSDYNPKTDLNPVPIFVLRKCKASENPCRIIIDNIGRVYDSWQGYLSRNKLPECEMVVPRHGRYQVDGDGKVILERHMSPACGVDIKILQGADTASSVVGLASGGIFLAAAIPAITIAPVALVAATATGIGVGLYSLGRSAFAIHDRRVHKESLSFANSEARGAYLNIVAGSLGFVGAGATLAVSQLASAGINISQGARGVVNVISVANIGATGVGVANSTFEVVYQWFDEDQVPSALTILQLSSSILFFGHAVYNFKLAGTIIEESQARTLKDYQDSLRSNRHRKTFNKLLKETIKQNNGDVSKGQAEVIKTVRHIQSKDEAFATLTRLNKDMNKNKVKFSAENGVIKLNGVEVDMALLGTMEKNEAVTFLSSLPSGQEPSPTTVETVQIKLSFGGFNAANAKSLAIALLKIVGNTETTIQEKIVEAFIVIVKELTTTPVFSDITTLFPGMEKYFQLIRMVTKFLQQLVNEIEERYQAWLKTRDPKLEEPIFPKLAVDYSKRFLKLLDVVMGLCLIRDNLTEFGYKRVMSFCTTWIAKESLARAEVQERKEHRKSHSGSPATKTYCTVCGGHYYS